MRPHDAADKLPFSFPDMVRDLLAGFVPRAWADALDLSTLERLPEGCMSEDLRQRHQDRIRRVRLLERVEVLCATSAARGEASRG